MTITALFRSYGGENLKNRPDFYSKDVALLSFLRAVEHAGVDVVFLNDGPIPEQRLRWMEKWGDVRSIESTGMRGSWITSLELAASWNPDTVVWLSEDDYLYLPEAFDRLGQAVDEQPDVDYFALYASTDRHSLYGSEQRRYEPRGWQPVTRTVGDHDWVRIYATTSTFGVRAGALAEDLGIFRLAMVPHRTMYRDRDMFVAVQGYEPHRWGSLARAAVGLSGGPARSRVRRMVLGPFLAATNLRAHRRPERRRTLMAADPNLATHLEEGLLSPGQDWRQVARDTREWALDAGLVDGAIDD